MVLNPEGRARFQSHLQAVLQRPCSVCGTGNWQVEEAIFELREFTGGPVAAEGAIKPVLAITCNGCGHVVFINPLKTGIIGISQQAPQAAQPVSASKEEAIEAAEESEA